MNTVGVMKGPEMMQRQVQTVCWVQCHQQSQGEDGVTTERDGEMLHSWLQDRAEFCAKAAGSLWDLKKKKSQRRGILL